MSTPTSYLTPFEEALSERKVRADAVRSFFASASKLSGSSKTSSTVSSLISKDAQSIKYALTKVSSSHVEILEKNLCSCDDWSTVFLLHQDMASDEVLYQAIKTKIRQCTFSGTVVLGLDLESTSQQKEVLLKPGIQQNTLISNSIIEPGATVFNNTIVANTYIGRNAKVINCGTIQCTPDYNDVMNIEIGPEAGGDRSVHVIPECTLVDICHCLSMTCSNTSKRNNLATIQWDKPTSLSSNIICGELMHTKSIKNLYVDVNASIVNCSSVKHAILLSESSVENAIANNVFLQWKASIVNNSNVSNTLLMECSEIGPNSVVAHTILGPDSHVSCGEVHCSIIGPNTNSHHQSLLISTLWPSGRGNVGYGSNIGSNHTGRIPDQEVASGEGVFWGLGCVIKMPVDVSKAYYSVIAAGVQLPPQSITMPFSLIMSGNHSNHAGMNEIVPGWLLAQSPYTILRSEEKFKSRRKAKRHDYYCGWKIIRPTTIDACMNARNNLVKVAESSASTTTFTIKDVSGIGSNYLSKRGLSLGINTYTEFIQRYALNGLLELLSSGADIEKVQELLSKSKLYHEELQTKSSQVSWPLLPWEEESHGNETKLLMHKLYILTKELPSILQSTKENQIDSFAEVGSKCLKKLIEIEENHARQVLRSKQRDDKRGKATVPGYSLAHVKAEDDKVVKLAQKQAKHIISKSNEMILLLLDAQSKL